MTLEQDIENAVKTLRAGGVVVYPTDTVWGVGCDARNSDAVRKVFSLKHRSDSKALITLVSNRGMLSNYTDVELFDRIQEAISFDAPTTIIYPYAKALAPELIAEDRSVGIRITSESVSQQLCDRFGHAIVSTSANISGESTPGCFADISPYIIEGADYVMFARREENVRNRPSKILKINKDGDIIIVRP